MTDARSEFQTARSIEKNVSRSRYDKDQQSSIALTNVPNKTR